MKSIKARVLYTPLKSLFLSNSIFTLSTSDYRTKNQKKKSCMNRQILYSHMYFTYWSPDNNNIQQFIDLINICLQITYTERWGITMTPIPSLTPGMLALKNWWTLNINKKIRTNTFKYKDLKVNNTQYFCQLSFGTYPSQNFLLSKLSCLILF